MRGHLGGQRFSVVCALFGLYSLYSILFVPLSPQKKEKVFTRTVKEKFQKRIGFWTGDTGTPNIRIPLQPNCYASDLGSESRPRKTRRPRKTLRNCAVNSQFQKMDTPKQIKWSKLPLEQREADVHRVLTINDADTSTLVNNLVAERMQSRRRRVTQNDNHERIRTVIVKERLRAKLAARKKALSEKQNDSRPAKTNAKKSRKRTRKKKGQPRPEA